VVRAWKSSSSGRNRSPIIRLDPDAPARASIRRSSTESSVSSAIASQRGSTFVASGASSGPMLSSSAFSSL
jgi:hypothetical protein